MIKKFASLLTVLALLVIVSPGSSDAAMIGSVAVTPNSIDQPGEVIVGGSCPLYGNTSDGNVNIIITSGSTMVTSSIQPNNAGAFVSTFNLPATFPVGSALVQATCPNGDYLTGILTVNNTQPSSTAYATLSGNPILGEALTISGFCGTTVAGGNVNINFVGNGTTTAFGSTLTTGNNGAFSGTFNVPSTLSSGATTLAVNCPNGTINLATNIIDPNDNSNSNNPATLIVNTVAPTAGGQLTVNGSCNDNTGNVNFTLTNINNQINLSGLSVGTSGSYSGSTTIPSSFSSGNALLIATCPSGAVATTAVMIGSVSSTGIVGGISTNPATDTGGSDTDSTPIGGVAAGLGGSSNPAGVNSLFMATLVLIAGALVYSIREKLSLNR